MMPWRKIAGLAVGATLVLGCTVTTSDGGADSGFFGNETGGSSSVGGSSASGGNSVGTTSTGGMTAAGGASTTVVCNPASEQPGSCGQCLQTADVVTSGDPGMCNEYTACAAVAGCTAIVNAMSTCMAGKAQAAGADTPPTGSDAACRAATSGMGANDTSASAKAAQTLWDAISINLYCGFPCWAENS